MELIFIVGPLFILILLKAGAFDSYFRNGNARRKPKLRLVSSEDEKTKHQPVFESLWNKPQSLDVVEKYYHQHEKNPQVEKIDA